MNSVSIFWLQLCSSITVFTLVAVWYVWPALMQMSRRSALVPLIFVHVPRYIGMTLLVAGVVDPKLPQDFLASAAYGDLVAAALGLTSIVALRGHWGAAIPLVWVFNTWSFLDLLNGVRNVIALNVPSYHLGSFWFVYTFYAPLVLVSHVMIYIILFKSRLWGSKSGHSMA